MSASYQQLRMLMPGKGAGAAVVLGCRDQPLAAAAAARHSLGDPSPAADRLLLAASNEGDDGAFLCLRCRVSEPIEEKIRGIHRQYGAHYQLDLPSLAAYGLDDDGRALSCPALRALPTSRIAPFTAQVLCSYDSSQGASLPHWARLKLQAHNGLKVYLREHGLLLISPWSLLADTSRRRVREVVEAFGGSNLTVQHAEALHAAYCQAFPAAKAEHRQRTGRSSGWVPSDAFLLSVAPDQPADTTREQLLAIDRAIRLLLSQRWQQSLDALEAADATPALSLEACTAELSGDDDNALLARISAALARALDPAVRAALATDQHRWSKAPDRRLAWQLYGEGLGQRAIAERCSHQQAWVSKVLQEKTLATTVATAAALELRRHPAFAGVAHSLEGAERLVEALRNHLLTSEREGDVAPLRCAVAQLLTALP